jgi:hypothetical protein
MKGPKRLWKGKNMKGTKKTWKDKKYEIIQKNMKDEKYERIKKYENIKNINGTKRIWKDKKYGRSKECGRILSMIGSIWIWKDPKEYERIKNMKDPKECERINGVHNVQCVCNIHLGMCEMSARLRGTIIMMCSTSSAVSDVVLYWCCVCNHHRLSGNISLISNALSLSCYKGSDDVLAYSLTTQITIC